MYILFFDDMISIKNFDPNKTKIVEKLYKNIIFHGIEYVTVKNIIINIINRKVEENNGKYLRPEKTH